MPIPHCRLLGYSPKGFNGGCGGGLWVALGQTWTPLMILKWETHLALIAASRCSSVRQHMTASFGAAASRFSSPRSVGVMQMKKKTQKKMLKIFCMEIMAGFVRLLQGHIETWEPLRWLEQPWKSCSPTAADPLGGKWQSDWYYGQTLFFFFLPNKVRPDGRCDKRFIHSQDTLIPWSPYFLR